MPNPIHAYKLPILFYELYYVPVIIRNMEYTVDLGGGAGIEPRMELSLELQLL